MSFIKTKEGIVGTFSLELVSQKYRWHLGLETGIWRWSNLVGLSPYPVESGLTLNNYCQGRHQLVSAENWRLALCGKPTNLVSEMLIIKTGHSLKEWGGCQLAFQGGKIHLWLKMKKWRRKWHIWGIIGIFSGSCGSNQILAWKDWSGHSLGKLDCIRMREEWCVNNNHIWKWDWVFFNFIYLFWERERERENPKQAPCCQHGALCRAQAYEPWDHDLSQNQKLDT